MKPRRPRRTKARGLTRREFGLASLAVAVAGCGPKPLPPSLDLAVYGDCRQYARIHRRIVNGIAARGPKVVVVAGDLVDRPGEQAEWDEFHEITKPARDRAPLLCCIGNHDVHPSQPFLREMKLPKFWYDRKIGDFHLFVLDSMSCFQDKEQVDWFRATAEASTAKHRIAVFHHPPFILDPKRSSETPKILELMHPLLARMKFCGALCGHQHAFYYTRRDGIPYVVTGGGGSALSTLDRSRMVAGDLARPVFHYVGLTVNGNRIDGRVHEPDGAEVRDLAFPFCSHA